MATDARNLLHALLVERVGFATKAEVLEAMKALQSENSPLILDVFIERGLISPTGRTVIEALTEEVVRSFGDEQTAINEIAALTMRESFVLHAPPDPILASTAFFERCVLGSRFEQLASIGKGGMGEVMRARDHDLNRDVAIKRIRSDKAHSKAIRDQFLYESKINASLTHPGIVALYDVGKDAEGSPFSVMRLVEGDTLRQRMIAYRDAFPRSARGSTKERLTFLELLQRFSAVCEAVEYAHRQHVVHRDLSPNNIIFGDLGENLIIDWGLATETFPDRGGDGPSIHGRFGTLAYSSPEQAAGHAEKVNAASDVYALGANLYYLLTCQPPIQYDHQDPQAEAHAVQDAIRGVFPRPSQVCPDVPRALEAICLKAMARRPEDRYPSAEALAADIKRYLADEPVTVYADPLPVLALRWARRHRTAVTAVGVLLATGLVALGVGNVLVRRERDIAVAALNIARGIITTLGKEIGDDAWAVIPNAELNRLNVMHESNRQYEALLRVEPQNDALRLEAVDGYRREGNLARLVVRYGEADRLYDRAHELVTGVLNATPGNARAIDERFNLLADRCVLQHFQADPAAGDGYREALAAAAAIQRQFPEVNVTGVVSRIKADYGGWQVDDGRPAEGLAMLCEAVAGLVVTGPSMQDGIDHTQMMLVATLCALSRAEAESGNISAAIATADRAIAAADVGLASAKVANHPDVVQMKAAALLQRAILAARAPDQLDAAIAQATAAVEIYGALAARNKKIAGHHHRLAEAVITRGEMLYTAGRRDEARKDAAAALTAVAAAEGGASGEQADVVRMVNLDAARAWLLKARLLTDANDPANAKPSLQQARERIDKELGNFPRCPESLRVKEGIETLGTATGEGQ